MREHREFGPNKAYFPCPPPHDGGRATVRYEFIQFLTGGMAPRSTEARSQLVTTYNHRSLHAFFNKDFVLLREWHLKRYYGWPKYGESSHYPCNVVLLKPSSVISDHEVRSLGGLSRHT